MANFNSSMPWPVALEISKNGSPRSFCQVAQGVHAGAILRYVHFGGHDDHRLGSQGFAVTASSRRMISKSSTGSRPLFGDVHQVRQQPVRSIWRQELDAEAVAFVRAFDDAGNVRNDVAAELAASARLPGSAPAW
jgi:hypothetical protein